MSWVMLTNIIVANAIMIKVIVVHCLVHPPDYDLLLVKVEMDGHTAWSTFRGFLFLFLHVDIP